MSWRCSLGRLGAALTMALLSAGPALAQPAAQTLVIGVDHGDPANQNPDQHRIFEYTDFFTRSVTVHTGDTLDFRLVPNAFHVIGLGPSDAAARAAYPVGSLDTEDPVQAIGTGLPKVIQGPGQSPIVGGSVHGGGTIGQINSPSTCGIVQLNQQPCTFKGGNDIEDSGGLNAVNPQTNQPRALDWKITINAPPGTYSYLCWIHPGMTGTLTVADPAVAATTQAQIDSQSAAQFAADRDAALAAEQAADVVSFTGDAPGSRTYQVSVGVGTDKVAIDEMLPRQPLTLTPGDKVQYVWKDPHNVHTVTFPTGSKQVPEPFGFDCGATFQSPPNGPPAAGAPPFQPCSDPSDKAPEFIGDPGTAPSGTALRDPSQVLDSGFIIGAGYGITSGTMQWTIVASATSKPGTYTYQCTLHDWMQGSLVLAASTTAPGPTTTGVAQTPAQIPAQMPNTGSGGQTLLWGGVTLLGLLLVGLGGVQLAARRG